MYRFGICEWCLPETGPAAIRHAGALGFTGIQITERGGWEAGFPLLDPAMQAAYLNAAEQSGVTLQALHLWSLCRLACMIHPLESEAAKIGVQSIWAAVRACEALGISRIMVTSGFMSQIKNRRDFENFAAHLKRACEIAGERNITIVFESVLTAGEIMTMAELVGPSLKICYDTFNPIRFHVGTPEEEISVLAPRIDHFHLKDGPEDLVGCALLGCGIGSFAAVARAIKAADQPCWLITENYYGAFPLDRQDSFDTLAAKDLATMQREFGGKACG